MYRLETTKPLYEDIKELLPDIWPNIQIRLVSDDPNLVKLGFADEVPCVMELDITDEELDEIMLELCTIETFAFYDGEPAKNDPYYLKYLKYCWMQDVLLGAKKVK